MLLCIRVAALVRWKYATKYGQLYQSQDYIVYLKYYNNVDCIPDALVV